MATARQPNSPARPGGRVVDQHWDPARYQRNAGFVAVLGQPVVELLAPRPDERILDLGCGEGTLTAVRARQARVTGVDASVEQVAAARVRGLDAHVADGTRLGCFAEEFDAVFSNAALHWMRDPDAVIDGVWRALKPGGCFVGECGGAGNVATVRGALVAVLARRGIDGDAASPWYFSRPPRSIAPDSSGVASPLRRSTSSGGRRRFPAVLPTGSTLSPRAFSPRCGRRSAPPSRTRSRRWCARRCTIRAAPGRSITYGSDSPR